MGQFDSQNGLRVGFSYGEQVGKLKLGIKTDLDINPYVLMLNVLGRRAHGSVKGNFGNQNDLAGFFQVTREAPRSAI